MLKALLAIALAVAPIYTYILLAAQRRQVRVVYVRPRRNRKNYINTETYRW